MKKFILTLTGLLILYVAGMIWLSWEVEFRPMEKLAGYGFALFVPILISISIAKENDWFSNK